jgi:protocatechuate 3,4-dioxygenase beta subunit
MAAAVAACGSGGNERAEPATTTSTQPTSATTNSTATTTAAAASCDTIPEETAGPFPGDGSNGPDILREPGVVRSDIRSSIGSASGVADGVPVTLALTVQDANCAALAGAAVYVWHCDREGSYSMYDGDAANENYLRGVQQTDADGRVSFTTIFPGAYSGRWPHVHFEIYESVDAATSGGTIVATSQLAYPEDVCNTVYEQDGYDGSAANMARTSLDDDMVFRDDGAVHQMATVTGDPQNGYTAELAVTVA